MGQTDDKAGRMAAVGMFDGVHLGHRHLLGELREEARRRGLCPLAVTFPCHPLGCIRPGREPRLLSEPEEKRALMEALGVEVAMLPFTPALRDTSAAGFLSLLRDRFGAEAMLLGFNNRFGHDAPADFNDYVALARGCGIEMVQGTEFDLAGEGAVSSSAIRRALGEGDVAHARRMLGRPYRLTGTVVGGKRIGRSIGFPTANIAPPSERKLIPAAGVYAALATLPDGSRREAVVNIGNNPTVNGHDGPQTVEAHLIGFENEIYGQPLTLDFAERLRGERRFPSLEALSAQIAADRDAAIAALGKPGATE